MVRFLLFVATTFLFFLPHPPESGLRFRFKGKEIVLTHPMRTDGSGFLPRGGHNKAQLDTLSNYFNPSLNYVEIIRQDDPVHPTFGAAIGFEFDEDNGEYPYTPAHAVLQLKDFRWGGPEFSARDTFNYTGVSNDVSNDLKIEIDSFRNNIFYGRFSGLLLSGAETMTMIEEGRFEVKVYRR